MITRIFNGKIIRENTVSEGLSLYFEDGKITAITVDNLPCDEEIDAGGSYISPGFIDMHTHRAGGFDFLDKTEEAYLVSARVHAEHGATAIVPTLTSVDIDGMK